MKTKTLALSLILLITGAVSAQAQVKYDTLSVGKIRQVLSYSGSKASPILLILHGGPGSSKMNKTEEISNQLQKHFLVVQWDQRDAGRTLALNKSLVPITVKLMEDDTYEVIRQLLKKLGQKKLYLLGESWGTVLGFKMAEKHPDLLNAYLAFSPVVNQTKSEQIVLDKLKMDAIEKNNMAARQELDRVKIPFENYKDIFYSRKWMFSYDGHPFADKDTTGLKDYMADWSKTWMTTWNQAVSQNLFIELPKINCPVYFFLGEKDLQTNFNINKEYFAVLKAPKKDLFLFKNAGHAVLNEEAEQVQKIIIDKILQTTEGQTKGVR